MNFDALGGRRHLLTWACLISANTLCIMDKLSGGEWGLVISAILTVYVGGNTVQKFKSGEVSNVGYRDREEDNQA
jgi:hypothetical protein